MNPRLILGALDEALRHVSPGEDTYTTHGAADARDVARSRSEDCHPQGQRGPQHLTAIDQELRHWIAGGPTMLDRGGEFERAYERVQQQVERILDGDLATVTRLLEQAHRRAQALLAEVRGGSEAPDA
jgi:hypothetical protein